MKRFNIAVAILEVILLITSIYLVLNTKGKHDFSLFILIYPVGAMIGLIIMAMIVNETKESVDRTTSNPTTRNRNLLLTLGIIAIAIIIYLKFKFKV